ncbi:MAG: hypothetical protein K1Y36_08710 [Blastocatellia bacterium]|nr:hypothetical protein [Blastocatellia bacterium]
MVGLFGFIQSLGPDYDYIAECEALTRDFKALQVWELGELIRKEKAKAGFSQFKPDLFGSLSILRRGAVNRLRGYE